MERIIGQSFGTRSLQLAMVGLIGAIGFTAVPSEARDDRRDWRDDRRDHRDYRRDDRRDHRYAYQQRQAQQQQRQAYRHGYRAGSQQNWGYSQPSRVYVPVRTPQPAYVYQGRGYPGYNGYQANSRGWVQGRDYWYGNGRYHCRRSDGTTGTVVGAVAGGTLGNILAGQGDKTLASIIGGTLGAIIGKEIEKGEARCR